MGLGRFRGPLFRLTAIDRQSSRLARRSGAQVQPDQGALGVGKVADQLADRLRKLTNDGGDGEDLVAPSQLRALQEIDYLDTVASVQVLVANSLEV